MQLLEHFKELTLHPKNAEELKGLILQLAVQGKLTRKWREENPDVEPASVLLEKIRAEKGRLVKVKEIKKENNYPNISIEEIHFDLPESWGWTRLGNYIHNFGQKNPDEKFEYIDVASVDNQLGIIKNELNILSPNEAPSRARKIVKKGCVIYSTVRPYLLNIAIVDREFSCEAIASTAFAIMNPILGCSEVYLYHVLRSYFFIKYVEGCMKGVAYPAINDANLLNGLIPIPPLAEQKAIVETVNQLFAEVEQLEALTRERIQLKADFVTSALNQLTQAAEQDTASQWDFLKSQFGTFFTEKENIKKLRESILQLAVQGKLTHHWRAIRQVEGTPIESASELLEKIKAGKEELIKAGKIKKEKQLSPISEEEIPYELPEGWIWCRIGQVLNVKSSKRVFKSDYVLEGVPFFRSKEIGQLGRGQEVTTELFISRERYEEYKINYGVTKPRDILIACIGGSIGNTWMVDEREFYYKDGNLVQLDSIPEIDSFYLLNYLNSKIFYDSALGIVSGSAYNALTIEKINNSLIPLPSEREQKVIVEKVNGLMALCDRLEQEIENYQTNQEQWMQSCLREVV